MDLVDLNQVLMPWPWLVIYFPLHNFLYIIEHKLIDDSNQIVCFLALNTEIQIEGGKQYTDLSRIDLSKFF